MKKLFLMCAFVIGVSAVSLAQGRQQQTPAQQVDRLKTSLALTDDQAAKATAIFTASAKSTDSLRAANTGGDRAAMRPAMMAIRKTASDKIMAILTPDQATTYKKQLADQAAAMAARQQGGGN
jgi:protein CpxP